MEKLSFTTEFLKTFESDENIFISPLTLNLLLSFLHQNDVENATFYDKYKQIDNWNVLVDSKAWGGIKNNLNFVTNFVFGKELEYSKKPALEGSRITDIALITKFEATNKSNMLDWIQRTYPTFKNIPQITENTIAVFNTSNFYFAWETVGLTVGIKETSEKKKMLSIKGPIKHMKDDNNGLECVSLLLNNLEFVFCSGKELEGMCSITFIKRIVAMLTSQEEKEKVVNLPEIDIKMNDNLIDNFNKLGLKSPIQVKSGIGKMAVGNMYHAMNFILNENGIGVKHLDVLTLKKEDDKKKCIVSEFETGISMMENPFIFFVVFKGSNVPLYFGKVGSYTKLYDQMLEDLNLLALLQIPSKGFIGGKPFEESKVGMLESEHLVKKTFLDALKDDSNAYKWIIKHKIVPISSEIIDVVLRIPKKNKLIYFILKYIDGNGFEGEFGEFLDKIVFSPIAVDIKSLGVMYFVKNIFDRKWEQSMLWRLILLLDGEKLTSDQKQIVIDRIKGEKYYAKITSQKAKDWLALPTNKKRLNEIKKKVKALSDYYNKEITEAYSLFEVTKKLIKEWLEKNESDEVQKYYDDNRIYDAMILTETTPPGFLQSPEGFKKRFDVIMEIKLNEEKQRLEKEVYEEQKKYLELTTESSVNLDDDTTITTTDAAVSTNEKKQVKSDCAKDYSSKEFQMMKRVVDKHKSTSDTDATTMYVADVVEEEKEEGEEFLRAKTEEAKRILEEYREEFDEMFDENDQL